MKVDVNKNIILEEVSTERKLARIPILMGAGAALHAGIGTGIESVINNQNEYNQEHLLHNALLGAGVGGVLGGINYFRDKGVGPTSLLAQSILPIKK